MSFPSYNPLTNGITTGAFGVVSFNIVGPTVGVVVAANAYLFTSNGEAMILAITIIAAIVVVFVFLLSFIFFVNYCCLDLIIRMDTNSICGFHLWNPDLVFVSFFISYQKIKSYNEESIHYTTTAATTTA
jgi:hypothetical protein